VEQPTILVLLLSEQTNNRSKVISIGGYLNRLLSFSSSSGPLNNTESAGPRFRLNDESENGEGNDYFFLDDVPDFDFDGSSTKSNSAETDGKNSTSSLIRRTSFSRSRGMVSGRQ